MDQVKAKMQALRAAADAATEKNEQLEKKIKDLEAQLSAVWSSPLHCTYSPPLPSLRPTMSWPRSRERCRW